ncbi:MAG TPA: DUF2075 domain-containing protein [Desulfobacterales bacterium]|nr:DUF2075 domain-containing protein [Desulfobacterales bacterium]
MIDHLAFFGFKETPFSLTPDRDFYFPSSRHKALEKVIMFGIDEGEGFIIVAGEIGTGKTMVLKHLSAKLAEKHEIAMVFSPLLSPRELVLAILRDIGLRSGNTDESIDSLLAALNDHLFKLSQENKRLLIIVDEAQDLYPESIEQLRLLSNFESDKQKFIQIILVGQPELLTLIEQPNLRQLLQRVTIIEELAPLSKREMTQYVHYRLSQAGRSDLRLSRSTVNILWRYSKGVPRLINWLMNRALLTACANKSREITPKCMYDAVDFLERRDRSPLFRKKYPLILLLAAAGVVAVIFYRLGFLVK